MIEDIICHYWLRAVLIALAALVLYGVSPGSGLADIMVLFVGLSLSSLLGEALRSPDSETPGSGISAQPELDPAVQRRPRARSLLEVGADAMGVITFGLIIPLDVALLTRDFFSLSTPQGWDGAIVASLCLASYGWPHRWLKGPEYSAIRISWWGLPIFIALPLLGGAVELRHPYLNPFNPDHDRLAAERVLAMKNTIVAGRDADWVLRYARQLDKRGESAKAIYYYQEGLRLNPYDRDATSRLAVLEAQVSGGLQGEAPFPAASSWAPYWTAESPIIKPLRRRIDSQLEDIEECTVVVVPVGKVSDDLLDAVGFTIRNELNLPVYVSPDSVPLPPHTRVRGLATGPQWEESVLAKAFINSVRSFPNAPVRYVLIVPADMYMEGTNYTFSTSYEWGGLVSFARFGGPDGDDPLLRRRTAKQALSALVQSFGVPKSIDRACVTSYTHSLEEFDAKGNRPNAETLRLFRKAVAGVNYDWQRYKASIGFGWGAAPKPGS